MHVSFECSAGIFLILSLGWQRGTIKIGPAGIRASSGLVRITGFLAEGLCALLGLSGSSRFARFMGPARTDGSCSISITVDSEDIGEFIAFQAPASFARLLVGQIVSGFRFPMGFDPHHSLSVGSQVLFVSNGLVGFKSGVSHLGGERVRMTHGPSSLSGWTSSLHRS